MILSDSEIQTRIYNDELIKYYSHENLKDCSYTLRVGEIFHPKTGENTILNDDQLSCSIGPSEFLVVRTYEKLNMPSDLSANFTTLFRQARNGLMMINASVVEPGYRGYLSCYLVNFSSESIAITQHEDIAKITFYEIRGKIKSPSDLVIEKDKYRASLVNYSMRYNSTFLDMEGIIDKTEKTAKSTVHKSLTTPAIIIAFLLAWSTLEPWFSRMLFDKIGLKSNTERAKEIILLDDLKDYELRIKQLDLESNIMEIEDLKDRLNKLEAISE